jgi:hypothetical protein
MEWFPHSLPAYGRCLRTFICRGWAYGSIINHHAIIITCTGPDVVGSQLKSCITDGHQRMSLCRGWGLYSSCNGSHIPFEHMEGVWQPSHAVVWWVYGSIIIIMPISLHVFTQIWEVSWNPASLLGYKGCHCAVIEALYFLTWNGFHIPSQHIKGDSQPSYDVDGHMALALTSNIG